MSDIQVAVLLVALAGLVWCLRGGLERESGPSGVLDAKTPEASMDRGREGVSLLLWGHFFSLLACIPLLAYSPFELYQGHFMGRWLSDFLPAWLRWAGVIQVVYAIPLWWGLRSTGRPAAARGLLLAAAVTAAWSALAWAFALNHRNASFSLQAGSGILALAAVVAIIWCGRELRNSLRG